MAAVLEELRRFLIKNNVQGGGIVVAVSGGADSVALSKSLSICKDEFHLQPVVIAHLNHQTRGAESDADAEFVKQLHDELSRDDPAGFRFELKSIDVKEQIIPGEGFESSARKLRYQWLEELAMKHNAQWIATGHNAEDQGETVLHRLIRGAGIKGLAGIPPLRALSDNITVIRPLLRVGRSDIIEFLDQHQQAYRQDSSNAELEYTRNRIRHELLPLLHDNYNPAIVTTLCRLAEQAGSIHEILEIDASELIAHSELPRAGDLLIFKNEVLEREALYRICEAFRLIWQREGWPMGQMGFEEWNRLASVVLGEQPSADLPERIRVRQTGRVIQLGPIKAFAS